jgi:hypothetical protein
MLTPARSDPARQKTTRGAPSSGAPFFVRSSMIDVGDSGLARSRGDIVQKRPLRPRSQEIRTLNGTVTRAPAIEHIPSMKGISSCA